MMTAVLWLPSDGHEYGSMFKTPPTVESFWTEEYVVARFF